MKFDHSAFDICQCSLGHFLQVFAFIPFSSEQSLLAAWACDWLRPVVYVGAGVVSQVTSSEQAKIEEWVCFLEDKKNQFCFSFLQNFKLLS